MDDTSMKMGESVDIHTLDAWLPTPESVVSGCEQLVSQGEPTEALRVIDTLGVPTGDLCVTPLGLVAGKLGARAGTAFYHHELRVRLPMPKALEPELAVWGEGTVPVWKDGVLGEPKYFSFFQDSPFIAFNPNHRRKWPAHELVHGAVGFFWRPDMTRFECYLGSRINELLPVVHWHGFDDIYRPQCSEHLGQPLYASYCARCEAMSDPYWTLSPDALEGLRPAALAHAEHGLSHFETEWHACLKELDTGRPHVTPLGKLDASSDARGYLRGHWNRLTAWSFGTWVELFCEDGVDYASTTEGLLARVGGVSREMWSGGAEIELSRTGARRARRMLQDIGYRCLIALESLEEGTDAAEQAEALLMPVLEDASRLCQGLLSNGARDNPVEEALPLICELAERVEKGRAYFGPELAESVGALAYRWVDTGLGAQAELAQLEAGVRSLGVAEEVEPALVACLPTFRDSRELDGRGSLCERLAAMSWPGEDGLDELLRFEAFLRAEPKSDPDAEDFSVLPESVDDLWSRGGSLRLNTTIKYQTFSVPFIRKQLGDAFLDGAVDSGEVTLLRGWFMGEPRIVVLEPVVNDLLEQIGTGRMLAEIEPTTSESLVSLLEHGCVIWSPAARKPSTRM